MGSPAGFAVSSYQGNIAWQQFKKENFTRKSGTTLFLSDLSFFSDHEFRGMYSALSGDEQKTADAYRHQTSKKQFIAGRYLTRFLCSLAVGASPGEIRFYLSEHNKPILADPVIPLCFNVSHAADRVLIGISFDGEIGVDIEKVNQDFDYLGFSDEHFSAGEKEMIARADKSMAIHHFYSTWTRKEAWLKLTGEGITGRLELYDVSKSENENAGIFITTFADGDYLLSVAQADKSTPDCFRINSLEGLL